MVDRPTRCLRRPRRAIRAGLVRPGCARRYVRAAGAAFFAGADRGRRLRGRARYAWLASRGFDVRGYDASAALLDEARRRHPDLTFELAALPALAGVPSGAFFATYAKRSSCISNSGGGGRRATGRTADAGRHVVHELAGGRKRRVARRARPPLHAARFRADALGARRRHASDRRARGRQRLVRQARAPADRTQGCRGRMSATRRHAHSRLSAASQLMSTQHLHAGRDRRGDRRRHAQVRPR